LVLEPQGPVDVGLTGSELAQVDAVHDVNHHRTKVGLMIKNPINAVHLTYNITP
jgi:hypothetical protein